MDSQSQTEPPNSFYKIFKEFIIHEDVFVQIMLFIPAYPYYFSYRCISRQWFYCLENKVYKLVQKLCLLNQHVDEVEEEKEKLKSINRQDLLLSFPKWKLIQNAGYLKKSTSQRAVMQFLTEVFPNVRKLRFLIWSRTSELLLQHCILNFAHLQSIHIYCLRYFADQSLPRYASTILQSLNTQYPIEKLKFVLFPFSNFRADFTAIKTNYKTITTVFAFNVTNRFISAESYPEIVAKSTVTDCSLELVNYIFSKKKLPIINFTPNLVDKQLSILFFDFFMIQKDVGFRKLVQVINLEPFVSLDILHQIARKDINYVVILLSSFLARKDGIDGCIFSNEAIRFCYECNRGICKIFDSSIMRLLKKLGWTLRCKDNNAFVNPLQIMLSHCNPYTVSLLRGIVESYPEIAFQGNSDGVITTDSEKDFDPFKKLCTIPLSISKKESIVEMAQILIQYCYNNQIPSNFVFWSLYYNRPLLSEDQRLKQVLYQIDESTLTSTPLLGCLLRVNNNNSKLQSLAELTREKNCKEIVSSNGDTLFHVYAKYTLVCSEPIIDYLIEQVGVNVKNKLNQTPLFFANQTRLVSYLIHNGAVTNLIDTFDRSIFEFQLERRWFETAIQFAPIMDDIENDRYWKVSSSTGRVLLHYLCDGLTAFCSENTYNPKQEPLQTMVKLYMKILSLSSKHVFFFTIDKIKGKSPIAYLLDSKAPHLTADLINCLENLETTPISATNELYIFYVMKNCATNTAYINYCLQYLNDWQARDATTSHHPTVLHTIVKLELIFALQFIVLHHKDEIDWNSVTSDGKSALDIAIEKGSVIMVDELLKVNKANQTLLQFDKTTVFHQAWNYQHYSLCAYFIEKNISTSTDRSILLSIMKQVVEQKCKSSFSSTLIHQLFSNLDIQVEEIYNLLITGLQNENFQFCTQFTEWLCNNIKPQLLLELFKKKDLLEIICSLRKEKASLNILQQLLPLVIAVDKEVLNQQNEIGKTALHFACQNMNLSVANYLYSLGADDTITENGSAKTCYELMEFESDEEMEKLKKMVCKGNKREAVPNTAAEKDTKRRKK